MPETPEKTPEKQVPAVKVEDDDEIPAVDENTVEMLSPKVRRTTPAPCQC